MEYSNFHRQLNRVLDEKTILEQKSTSTLPIKMCNKSSRTDYVDPLFVFSQLANFFHSLRNQFVAFADHVVEKFIQKNALFPLVTQ